MQYIYQFQLDQQHSKVGGTGSAWDARYNQAKTWTVEDPAIVGVWMVDDWKSSEKAVHSLLAPMKLPHRREIFNSSPETVFGIIKSVLGDPILHGDFLAEKKHFPSLSEVQSRLTELNRGKIEHRFMSDECINFHPSWFGKGNALHFGECGFDFVFVSMKWTKTGNSYNWASYDWQTGEGPIWGKVHRRTAGIYVPVLSDNIADLKERFSKAWKKYYREHREWNTPDDVSQLIIYGDYVGKMFLGDVVQNMPCSTLIYTTEELFSAYGAEE